jgi:hypothetical protein
MADLAHVHRVAVSKFVAEDVPHLVPIKEIALKLGLSYERPHRVYRARLDSASA